MLSGKDIDDNSYIDRHYGAIASKAVGYLTSLQGNQQPLIQAFVALFSLLLTAPLFSTPKVSVVPRDLNVPEQGQDDFKKAFGISWKDAVKQGKVLNAAQACKVGAHTVRCPETRADAPCTHIFIFYASAYITI